MPTLKIPIVGPTYLNVDEQALDVLNAEVRNLYVNEGQYSEKRPGLTEFVDLGTGNSIDALYWWDVAQVVLAVSNGQVWIITDALGSVGELTNTDLLQVGQQVSIDDNGTTAVLCNGTQILKTTTTLAGATFLADPDAPTTCSFVSFIDQYLAAINDATSTFQISEVGDHTDWRALDIFTAETRPDIIQAFHVGLGEMVFFGSRTIEFWRNDGVTPFIRINNATIERGIGAKHSVALVNDRWICLDENRKVIEIRGRNPVEVSGPVDRVIQGMSATSTAIGDVYTINGFPLYVLSFPEASRTLVYNYLKQDWSEWDYFNQTSGQMQRYRGNAYAYAKAWNKHLVGDHSNGKIYSATLDDLNDDGNPIKCRRRSGFVSHGTSKTKECNEIRLRVKQSVATAGIPNPQMTVRYRNDKGAWAVERWIDLGPVGDHDNVVRLTQLGQYRTRQWEVGFTDDAKFILMDAEEDLVVLDL